VDARIIGDRNATVGQCTPQFRNHWLSFPNLPAGDRRIVQVLLAPFGAFDDSNVHSIPVTGFATFYVTGWDSSPCATLGDDPAGNGELVGHFIKYIDTLNNGGGGGGFCDLNAFGSCVAVMTR
jgi:hypothetical protein